MPRNCTVAADIDNVNGQNLGTPTLGVGLVSAKMTPNAGVPPIRTTATVTGRDSGRPGFDQNGAWPGRVLRDSS